MQRKDQGRRIEPDQDLTMERCPGRYYTAVEALTLSWTFASRRRGVPVAWAR